MLEDASFVVYTRSSGFCTTAVAQYAIGRQSYSNAVNVASVTVASPGCELRGTRHNIASFEELRPGYGFLRKSSSPSATWSVVISTQWRSQRGVKVQPPPHSHRSRFLHSRKVTVIKYYNLSLTTRRTINSHDLRKTNRGGRVRESIVHQ